MLALTVAVLSLTAVGFFTSRISQGVRAQAAEVLAADLRLESPNPDAARYFAEARARGLRSAQLLSFPTAIFSGDASQLAALNAVSAGYPLRGHVRIADAPFGAARDHGSNSRPRRSVDRRAHHRAIETGAGSGAAHRRRRPFASPRCSTTGRIRAPVSSISRRRRCSTMRTSPRPQLIQPGSRVTYAALFAGPPAAVARFPRILVVQQGAGRASARGR